MLNCPVCLYDKKNYLFNVPGATVSNCPQCSHTFSHDVKVSSLEIYNENYFQEQHKNWFKHPNYPLFKKIAATCLKVFGNKNISILDVGCGKGDFLRYLAQEKFSNLTGVDFIQNSHDTIKFLQGNIFEISEKTFQQKFDFIATLATIEHVENIQGFMGILTSLVNPGGVICVMTLDESSFIYRAARWANKLGMAHGINRLYDKHHLNHFSKRSLRTLIENSKKYKIIEHYNINFPVKAIDLSKSIFNLVLRPIISLIFFLTNQLQRMQFLQVIFIKVC